MDETMTHTDRLVEMMINLLAEKSLTLISALLVVLIGWKIINMLIKFEEGAFAKIQMDPLIANFLSSFSLWTLRVLLLLSAASMLGVQTTSFLAVLGSAGLAIGLALQGSLSNLAGGVLILIIKPFRIGDFIEAGGHEGTVTKIQLFHTQLNMTDNRVVMLPNGPLAGGSLINYSSEPTRRIEFKIGISYSDDIKKAKKLLLELANKDSRILNEPEPLCVVMELGDSEVTLALRVWVERINFWPVRFELNEEAKILFDNNQITIPFPQRDVHMHQVLN
jgi:small conductance mechanosensitive channel